MGWFDGNPGRLWAHPPEALGPRYVDAIGGIDRVVDVARKAFDEGDFRWAATLFDHAIFTDQSRARHENSMPTPSNNSHTGPKCRLAQLLPRRCDRIARRGLRHAGADLDVDPGSADAGADVRHLRDQHQRAAGMGLDVAVDVTFLDAGTNYRLTLRNGVLVYRAVPADASTANATVKLANKLRLLTLPPVTATRPGWR